MAIDNNFSSDLNLVQEVVDAVIVSQFPIQLLALANCLIFAMWRFCEEDFMRKHFLSSPANRRRGYWWSEILSKFSQIELHHLSGNLVALSFFGNNCVSRLGSVAFYSFVATSAVISSFLENIWRNSQFFISKYRHTSSLGFSGINAALFALFVHCSPNCQLVLGTSRICSAKNALYTAITSDLVGLLCDCAGIINSPIHHMGHIFGYVSGVLIIIFSKLLRRPAQLIRQHRRMILVGAFLFLYYLSEIENPYELLFLLGKRKVRTLSSKIKKMPSKMKNPVMRHVDKAWRHFKGSTTAMWDNFLNFISCLSF